MLEREKAVLLDLEVLILVVGQVGDQDGRLAFDQADEAHGPAGDRVRDEEFFPVDEIIVPLAMGGCPQGGQVRSGAGLGQGEGAEAFAAGEPRQDAAFLLGRAKRPHRINRADAAVDRRQTGHRGVDRRHPAQERREGRERRPLPAVLWIDQQAPVTDLRQFLQDRLRDLALLVVERAGIAMAADDLQRALHHLIDALGDRRRLGQEQFDGQILIPDCAVRRRVDRLVLRREERFDLLVGAVELAGSLGLVGRLAGERQGDLDEGLLFRLLVLGPGGRGRFAEILAHRECPSVGELPPRPGRSVRGRPAGANGPRENCSGKAAGRPEKTGKSRAPVI